MLRQIKKKDKLEKRKKNINKLPLTYNVKYY